MKIAESVMRESWKAMIAKVEKYFPGSRNDGFIDDDYIQWNFIISKKKHWMFDVLNKIWCNMNIEFEWHDPSHPIIRENLSFGDGYTDLEEKNDIQYKLMAVI